MVDKLTLNKMRDLKGRASTARKQLQATDMEPVTKAHLDAALALIEELAAALAQEGPGASLEPTDTSGRRVKSP